jgi:hypothetical protein
VTPDAQHGDSAVISSAGGSVSAVSADGSHFILTVPPDAVAGAQQITLTPIAAISGLPGASRLVAAVQLAPEGLQLLAPATLTIEPSSSPAPDRILGFGYQATGTDFHLEPLFPGSGAPTFTITHFSGYGVDDGTVADLSGVTPATPEDQARQTIAEVLKGVRDRALQGGSDQLTDPERQKIEDALGSWYASVAQVAHSAESNESDLDAATAQVLAWERQGELLGFAFADQRAALAASLKIGYTNASQKAYDACVSTHDLFPIVKIFVYGEAATRLGLITPDFADVRAKGCATFELDLQSELQGITDEGLAWDSKVSSVVPLKPISLTVDSLTGETVIAYTGSPPPSAPLRFDQTAFQNASPQNCSDPAAHPSTATLTVVLGIRITNVAHSARLPAVAIDPDSPSENFTQECHSGSNSTTIDWPPFWKTAFRPVHGDEFDPPTSTYVIKDWSMLFDAVFAEKTYVRTVAVGGGSVVENTVLQLKHTPQL